VLIDLTCDKSSIVTSLLVGVGVSNLNGNVIGYDERGRMSADQVHPVYSQEVDENGCVGNDDRCHHPRIRPSGRARRFRELDQY
jgi:hypothetical protein